jgi:hypothetical protein
MIDVAVVGAILAVPPAIQAVRDLVARKDPSLAHQIEKSLKEAEKHLLEFSAIGGLFAEAKSYHEKLTQIDLAMSELLEAASLPTRKGGFDHDAFNRDHIFPGWRRIRDIREFLPSLIHLMQTCRQIADNPLSLGEAGEPTGGPRDFQLFVIYRNEMDGLIRSYDPRSTVDKERICDKLDEFSHHLRHQILVADTMIIENATNLADALSELRHRLSGGG